MGWRFEDSLRYDYEARSNEIVRMTSAVAVGMPMVAAMAELRRRRDIFQPVIGGAIIDCRF